MARRLDIKEVKGLNPIIRGAILGLIDGKRSGREIYQLAAAEAPEAGPVYYGVVTAEHILATLEAIAATGLARLK